MSKYSAQGTSIVWALLLTVCLLAPIATAQSISVNKACYASGENFAVTFVNVNPQPTDWIGFFPASEGNTNLQTLGAWVWTCGSHTCTTANAKGTVKVPDNISNGKWKAVLSSDQNPPYRSYAVSSTFTVGSSCSGGTSSGGGGSTTGSSAKLTLSATSFKSGAAITVSFQDPSAANDDFIGIFPASVSASQLGDGLLWKWLCNTQATVCSTAVTQGTVSFQSSSSNWNTQWPLGAGTYKAYLLRNQPSATFWPVIAASAEFTVTESGTPNERALQHLKTARSQIEAMISNDDRLAPMFLRLIFHDCIGGCDGCVDVSNPDNFGLDIPINALSNVVSQHANAATGISRSDIWALAASVGADVTQRSDSRVNFSSKWWGRVDCENTGKTCKDANGGSVACSATKGPFREFPGINMNTADLYGFFNSQFGFNQRQTVTIMGVHTLGVLKNANSGIDGPNGWVFENKVFDNGYYAELIGGNSPNDSTQTLVDDAPEWARTFENGKRFWTGFPNGVKIVMLNSDISLVRDLDSSNFDKSIGRVSCSFEDSLSSATVPICPHVSGALQIAAGFKADNLKWLQEFRNVLELLQTNGYSRLSCSDAVCKLSS